jgi:hypothetical protein
MAQRLRTDQSDRAPRASVVRKARDATTGLTVTGLAEAARHVSFAGTSSAGRRWARQPIEVSIVAALIQLSKDGKVISVHPIRPQAEGHCYRQSRLATGTPMSPRYYRDLKRGRSLGGRSSAAWHGSDRQRRTRRWSSSDFCRDCDHVGSPRTGPARVSPSSHLAQSATPEASGSHVCSADTGPSRRVT